MTAAAPSGGVVALTGATGFVGAALLRRLAADGRDVRCLARKPNRLNAGSGVDIVEGGLESPAALDRLVDGADAVVHCAGALGGGPRGELKRVNVSGSAALARAAARAGARRLVFASSLAAREPSLSEYAASKRAAEDALSRVAAAESMSVISLRLPAIYGPGDRNTEPLMRAMRMGVLPELGKESRFSLLFVEDAASALAAALDADSAVSGVFEIADDLSGGVSWRELADMVAEVSGRPVRLVPAPRGVADLAARVSGAAARLTGKRSIFTRGKVREMFHADWTVRDDAFTRATGWRPETPLPKGLTRTLEAL